MEATIRWLGPAPPTSSSTWRPTRRLADFKAFSGWDAPVGAFTPGPTAVSIGDVWIGDEVMIAQGVTSRRQGDHVGRAPSMREDVPPYAIVVGHPARVVRFRFDEPLIERFLEATWWRYPPNVVAPHPASDPERFLDDLAVVERDQPRAAMSPVHLTGAEIAAAVAPVDPAVAI